MFRTSLPRPFVALAAACLAAFVMGAPAAFAASQNRISGNISSGSRAEIADSVQPHVRAGSDLGPTAGDTKLSMSLRFQMTAAQSAALDQLLADQQNPASSRYHQWLTPAEFGAQFGLSQNDIAKVTAWLTAQGFTVTGVGNAETFVSFDGTVAQAEAAFGTSIHNVSWNGETHYANVTNATVPAALANVVSGIMGLHNFRAHARMHAIARPAFTSSVSGSHYLSPGDVNTIYDMKPLMAGYNGAGIGKCTSLSATCGDIAVTGQVDINTSDVSAFRSAAGLSTTNLPLTVHAAGIDPGAAQVCTATNPNCYPTAGDLEESSLDVEWSGAMAPGAGILFVNSSCALPGTGCGTDAMTWAIDNNLAPIVTTSYGNCEAAWGSTDLNSANTLFKQAAAQGQTVIAAAGDAGATDCDAGIPAIEGLTVDFPASSPYVLAMGGTMFNGDGAATGSGTTWSATQYWAGTSGSDVISSALGYIPEAVWNEDTASEELSAGGGGVSAFFSKPAWQVETGAAGMTTSVPADASRDVPDLALDAAAIHDPLLFCYTFNSVPSSNSSYDPGCVSGFRESAGGTLTVAGGTSFDSQMFGGMLALVEQKIGGRLGLAMPTIYALGNQAAYYNTGSTSVFHDITTGNNSNPCTVGTPNCPNGGDIGFSAATGYDLATGWGSVDLNNLATAWAQVTPLGTGSTGSNVSATSLIASATSVTTGSAVTLTATVTGAAGTPTGTVQFLDNNAALGTPVTLNSSGVATYTYNTSCASLGQQMMSAVYSGDGNYAGSKGPALLTGEAGESGGAGITSDNSVTTNPLIVTVTSSNCPDFSVTPSGASTSSASISISGSNATVTVSAGGTIPPVTLTVAPVNGFTGTVSFTASTVSTTSYSPTITFNPSSLTFTSNSTGSQTTTVNLSGITAELRAPSLPGREPGHPWYAAGSGVAIAGLFLLFLPQRRRLGGLLLVVLAITIAAGATGCSSSQQTVNPNSSSSNPDAGVYTVTVMATYSSGGQTTTHSSVITYDIE